MFEDEQPLIIVIDDDSSMRTSLSSLLRSSGFAVECYASIAEFSGRNDSSSSSCLLLDVRLQGANGLEFQTELMRKNIRLPIVFMTGHGDIPMSVRAMKAGAVDFLSKPFREQDLLDAVMLAVERDRTRRREMLATDELALRFGTLTAREREVMLLAVSGLLNKQIAGEIGTSEVTVKIHRGNAMKKMQAKTFADLVRMVQTLGITIRQ